MFIAYLYSNLLNVAEKPLFTGLCKVCHYCITVLQTCQIWKRWERPDLCTRLRLYPAMSKATMLAQSCITQNSNHWWVCVLLHYLTWPREECLGVSIPENRPYLPQVFSGVISASSKVATNLISATGFHPVLVPGGAKLCRALGYPYFVVSLDFTSCRKPDRC